MDDLIAIERVCREVTDYLYMQLWDKSRTVRKGKFTKVHLFDSNSGHLHPLNYCLGLAKACLQSGVQIYEQSPVVDFILQHPKSP